MKSFAILLCLLGLLFAVTGTAAEAPEQPESEVAKKIDSVGYEFTKGDKPEFIVTAKTTVPTGGYTAKLESVIYKTQPTDGIQDYYLHLTKPDGIVIQVISEVTASATWPAESAQWVKGVRVHGEGDGVVVKMIEQKK